MVWLDKTSGQMARIEGDVIDDIAFGLFLWENLQRQPLHAGALRICAGRLASHIFTIRFRRKKILFTISVHQKMFATNYRRVGTPADAIPLVKAELEKMGPATLADKKSAAN